MNELSSSGQVEVCLRVGVNPEYIAPESKVGVSKNVSNETVQPLNGLRHPPSGDTNGWYLWRGGDIRSDDDFFEPLHARHLEDRCPDALRYLALPPGWRFLLAQGQEEVWYDAELLAI